jgi:hypothetical protein
MLSRKLFILLVFCVFLPWVSCAGGDEGDLAEKEYEAIANSGALGEDLISALEDFEIRHRDHFDSKVDLGIYYLAVGETDRARDYLRRAERILLAGSASPGKKGYDAVMYGALAQVCLVREEHQEALEYIDLAIGADGENKKNYRFLKGHILIARQEYQAALEIFDELLANTAGDANILKAGGVSGDAAVNKAGDSNADGAGEDELRAYMFLLAQAERPVEAAAALDRYFLTGAFFPGLGRFGAAVYRAAGEMEKAACAAYLEEEYRSGYGEFQDSPPGAFDSLIEEMIPPSAAGGEGEIHFAAEYLGLKNLIDGGENLTKEQFLSLVELEPYFRMFPSFYWYLWLGAKLAYPEDRQYFDYFSAALQKIIALDKEGPFAKRAWAELTRLMGY